MDTNSTQPFALFENQSSSPGEFPYEFYTDPVHEVKTLHSSEVGRCLQKIQTLSTQGLFLVGYLSYDAFDVNTQTSKDPLVHFFAFGKRSFLTRQEFEKNLLPQLLPQTSSFSSPLVVSDFGVNETFASYKQKILQIKEHLRQGDTYQVNFTMKARFHWQGEPFQFFLELKKYQKVSMAAFFHFDRDICSYSPELFIRKDQNIITAKPMKGTAPRGQDKSSDELIISQMLNDKKTMSENLMIVDLIRNDLGQVAQPGTVTVPKLFEVETFTTLHQMTSTVQAQVDQDIDFEKLLRALFPCGSITGAPKKSTMKIIRDLECEPRGLYTGAIGYLLPSGDFVFNVAIRTLLFKDNAGPLNSGLKSGEMGLGSGIVFASDIENEWAECLLKGRFVGLVNSTFHLIESFRYEASSQTFLRLDLHLQRMSESAAALGFTCPIDKIRHDLFKLKNLLSTISADQKIRLLLSNSGEYTWTYHPLGPTPQVYQVLCCETPILRQSILQRHKTTRRSFYDECFAKAVKLGYDEILFFNQDGHCVEGSRHNLIIKSNKRFLTPPTSDGALPGVFRQSLFQDPSVNLREQAFGWTELMEATEVYLCNSVRGLVRANILPTRVSL